MLVDALSSVIEYGVWVGAAYQAHPSADPGALEEVVRELS